MKIHDICFADKITLKYKVPRGIYEMHSCLMCSMPALNLPNKGHSEHFKGHSEYFKGHSSRKQAFSNVT